MRTTARSFALMIVGCTTALMAQSAPQPTTAATAATRDSSYIDAQGTAYVTRVMPVPADLSPEARKSLIRRTPDQAPLESLEHRRASTDAWAARARAAWTQLCPNTIAESSIAGVRVRIVTPANLSSTGHDKVLLNLHGGGFNSDSGSFTETIPIAGYTGLKVIAVLYRLAPEHTFPAPVDDAVAVYRELLKTYQPGHIILYGTSAGAILTAETAVKLKMLGLPLPAGLGIFSALDNFAHEGDSQAMYTLLGFAGHLDPPAGGAHDPYYIGSTNPQDPVLSPIYADLHGLPPALFITSGRDALLSGTINLHRAYLRAGVDARLVVFDALPHAFWYDSSLPESIEANHIMANFMLKQLHQ
jgi:monoterpene epsilon-lactone hydrolase